MQSRVQILVQNELPVRAQVRVQNLKLANERIKRLMDVKRLRGMKLRYGPSGRAGEYQVEGSQEAVRIAEKVLRGI